LIAGNASVRPEPPATRSPAATGTETRDLAGNRPFPARPDEPLRTSNQRQANTHVSPPTRPLTKIRTADDVRRVVNTGAVSTASIRDTLNELAALVRNDELRGSVGTDLLAVRFQAALDAHKAREPYA